MKEFDITLDLIKVIQIEHIEVVQGDKDTNTFNIRITKKYEPFDLTGMTIEVMFAKPDGTTVLQDDADVVNAAVGKFQLVLRTNTIAASGFVFAEVRIKEDGKIATTAQFRFFVRQSIVSNVKSSNEFPALEKLIQETQPILETYPKVKQTFDSIQQDYPVWEQAETNRTVAEQGRVEAEIRREQTFAQMGSELENITSALELSEQVRVTTEDLRSKAEQERVKAEQLREQKLSQMSSGIENTMSELELAEQNRVTAEGARVTAEQEREQKLAQIDTKVVNVQSQLADITTYINTPVATYVHTTNKEIVVSTADLETNTFTSVGHGLSNNNRVSVVLNTDNKVIDYAKKYLPGGLDFAQYYIINRTDNAFQLSTSVNGVAIDITDKATIDLTKWHLESPRGDLVITNLPPSKKYKVIIRGTTLRSPYIIPNSADRNNVYVENGSLYTNRYQNFLLIGHLYMYAEIFIDFTDFLRIRAISNTVSATSDTTNTVSINDKLFISTVDNNQYITTINFFDMYPHNNITVEVYKI